MPSVATAGAAGNDADEGVVEVAASVGEGAGARVLTPNGTCRTEPPQG
jgi:hypothetical protein